MCQPRSVARSPKDDLNPTNKSRPPSNAGMGEQVGEPKAGTHEPQEGQGYERRWGAADLARPGQHAAMPLRPVMRLIRGELAAATFPEGERTGTWCRTANPRETPPHGIGVPGGRA
jgi:hypothetical protein